MIVLSPYSRKLRNNNENPKNYPWWIELINLLKQYDSNIIQIGVQGEISLVQRTHYNLPLKEIISLINLCDFFIAPDNFLQHLVNAKRLNKKGVVLWSQSDPLIFGYPQNINILKDRKYLRKGNDQFHIWEQAEYNIDAYVSPTVIIERLKLEGLLK